MRLKFKKYLLATKEFPLEFDSKEDDGCLTDNIEEAYLFDNEKNVKDTIEQYDEPDLYQPLLVTITYDF